MRSWGRRAVSSNPGHAWGKAGPAGWGVAVCQAGGPARCPQASETSQCQEHACWVQGAGDITHPGCLTALSGGPQSMGQPPGFHPYEVGWVWMSLGSSRGQGGSTGWVGRGQGPLPAIPYSPTSCPHPCPPPTLLLASQSISQLLEGSHCQPKAGQRDRLAGWSSSQSCPPGQKGTCRVVSPEAGDRYPEEQARCNHRHHVPAVSPSKQSSLPVLSPPLFPGCASLQDVLGGCPAGHGLSCCSPAL